MSPWRSVIVALLFAKLLTAAPVDPWVIEGADPWVVEGVERWVLRDPTSRAAGWVHGVQVSKTFQSRSAGIARAADNKTFTQRVDHNNANSGTWTQRYWMNTTNYRNGGPMFLYINGGHDTNYMTMLDWGLDWDNLAKQHGAAIYELEHRYFGTSFPTTDLSTSNLQYLSVRQVVRDLENFMRTIAPNDKWITFGFEYGGMLATKLRLDYPNLVVGSVASSPPLKLQLDWPEVFVAVWQRYNARSTTCPDRVNAAFSEFRRQMTSSSEQGGLSDMFNLCPKLSGTTTDLDRTRLMVEMTAIYQEIGLAPSDQPVVNVRTMCDVYSNPMRTEQNWTPLQRMKQFHDFSWPFATYLNCVDYNISDFVPQMQNTNISSDFAAARAFFYQDCSEFGLIPTLDPGSNMFGNNTINSTYRVDDCSRIFGFDRTRVEQGIINASIFFGGNDLDATYRSASNIILTYGEFDPSLPLGIRPNQFPSVTSMIIDKAGVVSDIGQPDDCETGSLAFARNTIRTQLTAWLGDGGTAPTTTVTTPVPATTTQAANSLTAAFPLAAALILAYFSRLLF